MTDTVALAIILIPCLIVAIVFHEVAHGLTALALGDPTARESRRLSLNPLRHVDPVGTLLVPGALALTGGPIFGWAKPVPVRKARLDNPRFGMMAVAAAGPATNLVLAAVAAVVLGLAARGVGGQLSSGEDLLFTGLNYFIVINIFLAMFNLLPIPPFDGSHIVEGLLPPRAARFYERLRPAGMLFLIGLIVLAWLAPGLGIIEHVVVPPVEWALGYYNAIAQMVAGV